MTTKPTYEELEQKVKELMKEEKDRRRSEERLKRSEASLAEAQRISHLGNWDWNIITNELHWSDEIYRIFGLTPQEFGATYEAFLDAVHPDDREFVEKAVDEALYGDKSYTLDHRIVLPDGSERVVHEQAAVTFDEEGKPTRMVGTVHDITEYKQTEEALRESEERFKTVADFTYDWEYWIAPNGDQIYVSPSCERITGYSPDQFQGDPGLLEAITHPEDLPLLSRHLQYEMEKQEAISIDFRIINRSKEERWIAHICQPVYNDEGRYVGRRASNRDVTERMRMERALKKSEEELRRLSSQLLKAYEEERKRIALELHDSLGQTLSAIKFMVENVLHGVVEEENAKGAESLESIVTVVQEAIEEARRIQRNLRPPILDDLGILPTISWFCREFEKTYPAIRIEGQIDIEEDDVPDSLKIIIFRVMQEAFHNIAKYSRAKLVRLSLKGSDDKIDLGINDDGIGFDVDHVFGNGKWNTGLGLTSMRERAALSGGSLVIESEKGVGTTVRASWPMRRGIQ
jgi:PAS domain S-box-containing protein